MAWRWLEPLGLSKSIFSILEKKTATHSSVLAWRIPWTKEPGGLPFMGSQRVGQCRTQRAEWLSTMFSIHSSRNAFCSDSVKHAYRDPQSYSLNSDLFDKYPVKRTEQIQLLPPTKKTLWMYITYKYISMVPSSSFRPLVCSPHIPSDPTPAVCVCVYVRQRERERESGGY